MVLFEEDDNGEVICFEVTVTDEVGLDRTAKNRAPEAMADLVTNVAIFFGWFFPFELMRKGSLNPKLRQM